jgi:hypothetical protein
VLLRASALPEGGISFGGTDACLLRVRALHSTLLWERRKPRRVAKRPLPRTTRKNVALSTITQIDGAVITLFDVSVSRSL